MYRQYQRELIEYMNAQAVLNDIINEYDLAFQRTMPHSPSYFGIKTNTRINKVEEFIIEVERKNLKRRSEDARTVLSLKAHLLGLKEADLRKSFDIHDVLYTAKWLDHKTVKDIIHDLKRKGFDYSPSQVYVILKQISNEIS